MLHACICLGCIGQPYKPQQCLRHLHLQAMHMHCLLRLLQLYDSLQSWKVDVPQGNLLCRLKGWLGVNCCSCISSPCTSIYPCVTTLARQSESSYDRLGGGGVTEWKP